MQILLQEGAMARVTDEKEYGRVVEHYLRNKSSLSEMLKTLPSPALAQVWCDVNCLRVRLIAIPTGAAFFSTSDPSKRHVWKAPTAELIQKHLLDRIPDTSRLMILFYGKQGNGLSTAIDRIYFNRAITGSLIKLESSLPLSMLPEEIQALLVQ